MKQPVWNCAAAVASPGTPRHPDCTGAVDVLARHGGPGRGRAGPCGPDRRGNAGGTVRQEDPHCPAAGRKRGFAGGARRPPALDKARGLGKRAVLIFEFDVPPHAAEGGAGSPFGDALKLAKFLSGEELNAATTVAYLPKSIRGHAVLAGAGLRPDHHGGEGHDRRPPARMSRSSTRPNGSPTRKSPAGGGPCRWNWPWECSVRGRRRSDGAYRGQHGIRHPGRTGEIAKAPHDPIAGGR